jgi:hypothetical protein
MKMLTIKIASLVGIAVAAPMILPGPDGEPMMTWDDWIPHDLLNKISQVSEFVDTASDSVSAGVNPEGNAIYRWVDSEGNLHFSDTYVEGAEQTNVDDTILTIPSEQFVHHGMVEAEPAGKPSTFLIGDRSKGSRSSKNGASSATLQDVGDLANGDLSQLSDVLENMPELLQQAQKARQTDPMSR